jgi:outer membrane lipoprotein-sorting protein
MVRWRAYTVLQIVLTLIMLTVVGPSAVAAPSLTAPEIVSHLENATDPIEDLTATITIQKYKDSAVSFTQQMLLTLKQPNKMKQEYLAPDYLAGNITLIVGDTMRIYIAVTEQWLKKDLADLSPAEQPWLMFRSILSGVRSDLDDYTFTCIDDSEVGDVYHIRGTPANNAAVYGRLDLWVDNETFTPVRRLLYDTDGELLVDARFLNKTRVDDVVTMPLLIETYNADGELQNVITYTNVALNTSVSDAAFSAPGESNG